MIMVTAAASAAVAAKAAARTRGVTEDRAAGARRNRARASANRPDTPGVTT